MPVYSEYDFERFSGRIMRRIAERTQQLEAEASEALRRAERESAAGSEAELEELRAEWQRELRLLEAQERSRLREEFMQRWSAFEHGREAALKAALRAKLETHFPELARCFITWICDRYEGGSLTLPAAYAGWVESDRIALHESKEAAVVFRQGNLHITFSVEGMMEELAGDTAEVLGCEEQRWHI